MRIAHCARAAFYREIGPPILFITDAVFNLHIEYMHKIKHVCYSPQCMKTPSLKTCYSPACRQLLTAVAKARHKNAKHKNKSKKTKRKSKKTKRKSKKTKRKNARHKIKSMTKKAKRRL